MKKTFTLVEVVLVAAIVVVLAAAVIPIVQKSRENARVARITALSDTLKATIDARGSKFLLII